MSPLLAIYEQETAELVAITVGKRKKRNKKYAWEQEFPTDLLAGKKAGADPSPSPRKPASAAPSDAASPRKPASAAPSSSSRSRGNAKGEKK